MVCEKLSVDRQRELSNCNFLKTVLMLSIVFYHSIVFWRGGWNVLPITPVVQPATLKWLAYWLAGFQNYAFVFVSGYLFYYVKYERGGYDHFGSFIKNKASRLLVPFLFIGLVWVIPISWVYLKQDLQQTVVDYLMVWDAGQLWFLFMLFGVFVLFFPMANLFKDKHLLGLGIVLGIYAFRFVGWRLVPGYFSVWNITKYFVVFWTGFKFRQGFLDFLRKVPICAYVSLYTILVVAENAALPLPKGIVSKLFEYGIEFLLHIIGAIMAFLVLQRIADLFNWKNNKLFQFFSKRSMVIYLLHQQVIYFLILELNGKINAYVHVLITFVVATLISSLLASVLMKFSGTRFLVGEK